MLEKKFKLFDVILLYKEINGDDVLNVLSIPQLKGIINDEDLKSIPLYKLKVLNNLLKPHIDNVREVVESSIKKHGEEKDGGISINPDNPKYELFMNDLNELLGQEVEFKYKPFTLSDIEAYKVNQYCNIIFTLVEDE